MKAGHLTLALLALALPAAASARPVRVAPAKHVRSVRVAAEPSRTSVERHVSLRPLPRSQTALRRAKRAAERRRAHARVRARPRARSSSPRARAALVAGPSAPGLRASDALFGVPPDTTGSIGPGHFVEEVNDAVAVYRRSDLARVAGPLFNELFMASPAGTFVSDPQMQWDQVSGRWFYSAVAFTADLSTGLPVGPNHLLYGFSRTSNPTDLVTGWCRYRIRSGSAPDGTAILDDFPKLGHDDQHILIGTNAFAIGRDGEEDFLTARIWSVRKPAAGPLVTCPPGAPATAFGSAESPLRTADGDLAVTPVPANTTDPSAIGYVTAADDPTAGGPKSQVMVWHVGGTGSSPTLVEDGNVAVAQYGVPAPARQFVFPRIDTLDGRLTMAVAHADPGAGGREAVWTQHTVDPGNGRVAMRWYELIPSTLTARQQGTVSDAGLDVFNGAVSPSSGGSAAGLVYNRSGPLLLPEIRARSHTAAMALGATGGGLLLATSEDPDYDLGCLPVCRWGDYSGASPDPLDPSRVWVAGQRIARPGGLLPNWTTRITALDVSAP